MEELHVPYLQFFFAESQENCAEKYVLNTVRSTVSIYQFYDGV